MNITYSAALPDKNNFYDLFLSTGWNDEFKLNPDELERAVSKSYFTVSAYHGELLVGFGRIVSDGILHAMIYEMIIHPGYQRKGIGTEILNRLIQKCKGDKIRDLQLFCAQGKKEFYEKHGFTSRPEDAPGMQYQFR